MAILHADRDDLSRFIGALFRYADDGTFVSLRAFDQTDRSKPPALIRPIPIGGDLSRLIDAATSAAEDMANRPRPIVFAPPICTFSNGDRARLEDLSNGLTLSVEIDDGDTRSARKRLEGLLGPATIIVESGGEWADPLSGEVFPKLHLHWRLSEPTREQIDHGKLLQARDMAARLVGADPTGKPVVHPLRWPGSWNMKDVPRIARIVAFNEAAEIHLDEALEITTVAIEAAGLLAADLPVSGKPEAPATLLAGAMQAIPNPGTEVHYDQWVRLGYATYRATGGTGFAIWDEWSRKSEKYDAGETETVWRRVGRAIVGSSAPRTIGAGTIFFEAKLHGWVRLRDSEPPPDLEDPGYYEALDREAAMSADAWEDLEARTGGHSIPASPEARAKAGPGVLWQITDPWLEAEIPRRPWIARGYLMRRAVTVVSGPGSAGKSSLMVAWATAAILGASFGRMKLAGRLKLATYNVEDDADEQRRRFSAMFRKIGVPIDRVSDHLAILGPNRVGTLLSTARDGSLLVNTPVMDRLEAFVTEFNPDIMMLDPFVELHAAEENDNTAVRAVMARFRAMAIEHDMAVVILHHARKGGGASPGDPDSLRGASSIVGAARVALTLNVMTEKEAEAFRPPIEKRHNFFRLDHAKSNYAPIEDAEWFERIEVKIDNGAETEEADGVAVAWPWKPPTAILQSSPADIDRALDIIDAGLGGGILFSPNKRGGGTDKWVGQVLRNVLGVTEPQAEKMTREWIASGLLVVSTFIHPRWRRETPGVLVNPAKRAPA